MTSEAPLLVSARNSWLHLHKTLKFPSKMLDARVALWVMKAAGLVREEDCME